MRQRQASPSFVKSPNLAKCSRIYLWADIHCSRDSAGSVQCVDLFSWAVLARLQVPRNHYLSALDLNPITKVLSHNCVNVFVFLISADGHKSIKGLHQYYEKPMLWALLALNAVYGNTSLQSVRHCPSLFDLLFLELETNHREVSHSLRAFSWLEVPRYSCREEWEGNLEITSHPVDHHSCVV